MAPKVNCECSLFHSSFQRVDAKESSPWTIPEYHSKGKFAFAIAGGRGGGGEWDTNGIVTYEHRSTLNQC